MSTNSYTIEVTASDSAIRFDDRCQDDSTEVNVSGTTRHESSFTLYACAVTTESTVTATLEHGGSELDRAEKSIRVPTPLAPDRPEDLVVDEESNGTLRFSWQPSKGATRYNGELTNTETNRSSIRNSTSTTHTFDNLTNGVTYRFRVRACNDSACGPWAGPIEGTPEHQLVAPTDLDIVPVIRNAFGTRIAYGAELSWVDDANMRDSTKYVVQRRTRKFTVVAATSTSTTAYRGLNTEPRGSSRNSVNQRRSSPAVQISGFDGSVDLDDPQQVESKFDVNLSGLSWDTLYRLTLRASDTKNSNPVMGFSRDCADRVETVLFGESEPNDEYNPTMSFTLYFCSPGKATLEVEVGRENWDVEDTAEVGVGQTSFRTPEFDRDDHDGHFLEEYRLQAVDDGSTGAQPSEFSTPAISIDTPFTEVDGDDREVNLKWTPMKDILGPLFEEGDATFRYRRFLEVNGHDHTEKKWNPLRLNPAIPTTSNPITLVRQGELYAVQFVTEVTRKGATFQVFASRDSYVWPSDRRPFLGERVATFPHRYAVTDGNYIYRICEDTLPVIDKEKRARMIRHALGQWQVATGGLIKMTYEDLLCAKYGRFVQLAYDEFKDHDSTISTTTRNRILTDLMDTFKKNGLEGKHSANRVQNEVRVYDDMDERYEKLREVGALDELAEDLGLIPCIYAERVLGCIRQVLVSGDPVADIYVKLSEFPNESTTLPDEMPGGDDVVDRMDTIRNTCDDKIQHSGYNLLLHEAGHAIGIGGFFARTQEDSHPTFRPLVMYGYGPSKECSPTPFDVLGIYALYQSMG